MKHKETAQISKSAYQLVQHAKSVASQNLVTAVARGDLRVERSELQKLVAVVESSIDESFLSASRAFETEVDATLAAVAVTTGKAKK